MLPRRLLRHRVVGRRRHLQVGVIGHGNMGRGVAASLARAGHDVVVYDADGAQTLRRPSTITAVDSVAAACRRADAVLLSLPHEAAERAVVADLLEARPPLVLNLGTSSVGWAREAHEACGGAGVAYLDAPVSGGPEGAAAGSLAVFLGGDEAAVRRAAPVLDAIAARFARLGPAGAGAGAKLVNQALVAANAQGAAEGLALAEALGCDLEQLLPLLDGAWAASTMLARSGARRLGADPARLAFESSAAPLRNFAKDLALVRDAAAGRGLDLPAVRVAAETVAAAAARGAADCDWAAVPSFLARPTTANELARAAPPFSDAVPTAEALRAALAAQASPSLPVVDDDPTGTQTVHGVAVRADWADLSGELRSDKSCFYLLANTRALDEAAAVARNREIGRELRRGGPRLVVSRSDSTLRGHFPAEVDALADGLGWRRPLVLVAPQFFGGGRVTADGVHYVLGAPVDGDRPATPAGETEFARDRAFGYRRSRLAEWVAEKTRGSADYAHTWHLSLHAIRGGVRAVQDAFEAALLDETVRAVCVDGLEDRDMLVVASGLKAAMAAQRGALHARGGVVVRSAGSAVAALTGMPPKPFLGREALSPSSGGGLVVVGSYTQKTSAQLAELRRRCGWLDAVEVDVGEVLADAEGAVARASAAAAAALGAGRSACVFTSRRVQQDDGSGGLVIGAKVNEALCAVAARVVERATPAFVVAKGGITSNDVAVKSLGVRRADVLGQVVAGVPAWRLGRESRLPGASYVVFPGNVGDADDLATVVETVAGARRPAASPKMTCVEALVDARGRGRALGAFNVYTLEGALAVARGAAAARRAAIVQLHPAALDHGGPALLAACRRLADAAEVPLFVALDHCEDPGRIYPHLEAVDHVMADGSRFDVGENERWTAAVAARARAAGVSVEAELGRLAGEEDGLSVDERDARMTDPAIVAAFLARTRVDALAVTVGNVHGAYASRDPDLDWARLDAVRAAAGDVPLVLHGASGLSQRVISRAISAGVCKFNVNTELRAAARAAYAEGGDVLAAAERATSAMAGVVEAKLLAFDAGS